MVCTRDELTERPQGDRSQNQNKPSDQKKISSPKFWKEEAVLHGVLWSCFRSLLISRVEACGDSHSSRSGCAPAQVEALQARAECVAGLMLAEQVVVFGWRKQSPGHSWSSSVATSGHVTPPPPERKKIPLKNIIQIYWYQRDHKCSHGDFKFEFSRLNTRVLMWHVFMNEGRCSPVTGVIHPKTTLLSCSVH